MKVLTYPLLVAVLLNASLLGHVAAEEGTTVTEESNGRVKIQTIATQDRLGTTEEKRVQAMYSEIRYIPNDSDGYLLIGTEGDSSKWHSAHSESNELMIPSWSLMKW